MSFPFSFLPTILSLVTVLTKSEEAIEKRYVNATSALSTKFGLGGSGKDGPALAARTEENGEAGEADESDGKACSIDLVDEKKEDENDEMESSTQTNVAAMKIRFSSFSSSVNATCVGGGSSADGDSNETTPSTSLKRISDALGQAKKSPSSLKMSFGVAKGPFPQSSSSLKISKLKSKISSKIQISSNRQAAAAKNTNDIEQESIMFHVEE